MLGKCPRAIRIGEADPSEIDIHPQDMIKTNTKENTSSNKKQNNSSENTNYRNQAKEIEVLNSISDIRPFLEVSIYNRRFKGLLDSGATVTVKKYCSVIKEHEHEMTHTNVSLKVANKGFLEVLGRMEIPFQYEGHSITLPTIIVSDLEQELILGYDFWKKAGLKIKDDRNGRVLAVSPDAPIVVETEMELQEHDQKALQEAVGHFLITTKEFLGRTHLIEHTIELIEGAKPFVRRSHFYSPILQGAINKELDNMLEAGVVKPSKSPVASPVVPVKKQDGSVRLCLDSRQLNLITKRDQFPIPNPNHIFARMQRSNYLTAIDLSKAFWQIPLSEKNIKNQFANSQELTAFIVPGRGLFQFTVMPFGLCNSPATQCRLMYKVLGHDLEPYCMIYMDDILIATRTIEHMVELIRKVAIRLRESGLSINIQKSRFLAKKVKYLGYVLDDQGMSADPSRLQIMKDYPKPRNVKSVRRFLGLTGYYRRLIRDYSGIASPLTNLLRKEAKRFAWSEGANEAFQRLKDAMCNAPVVANPDFDLDFHIQCDASDTSGAAALGQKYEKAEVIIAYFSHKWNKAEAKWGATEREAACVLYALRHFRDYIWGRPVTIITDAQALIHIRTLKTDGSSRLARWALELNEFDLNILHRAGKLSVVPDALSRAVESIQMVEQGEQDSWEREMIRKVRENPEQYPDFKVVGTSLMKYESMKDDIGCYAYRWKQYVPEEQRGTMIKEIHEKLCHVGWEKCAPFINQRFFWPKMKATIEKEIRKCDICKSTKATNKNTRVPMGQSRKAEFPFQVVAIDHWGPAPKSRKGNAFVLLHPSRDTCSETVVKFLEEQVFLKFGTPEKLITDNHRPLIGRNMVELLNKYNVEHLTIAAYHAQANPAERYIKTVSTAIRATLAQNDRDHRKWDEDISLIERALNVTKNESTKKSPFFVNFGREAVLTGNEYRTIQSQSNREQMEETQLQQRFQMLRNEIRTNLETAQSKFRAQYDKTSKPLTFNINERVWRKNRILSNASQYISQKLSPKYVACKIVEHIGRDTYKVQDENQGGIHRIHANDLIKDYQ